MRNASGLTAADLAHAQGFRECAEVLSNAQNLQRNLAQSQTQLNEFFVNGTGGQNGHHSQPTSQGRSFLNGVPNRKRSFDSMDVSQTKKARINGLDIPSQVLNGNGPLGGAGDFQMECVNMESTDTVCSALGALPCEDISLNGQSKPQIPNGYDPTLEPDIMHQDIYRNASETISNGTAGSQVEHQKSVTAEQLYDHALFSTMLLYHGS